MLALIAAGFAISSALRPRGEEDDGLAEPLLATALPRRWWLSATSASRSPARRWSSSSPASGLGAGYAMVTGDGAAVGQYTVAALPYVAPILVLSGLTRLLYGVAPRAASLAWLGLLFCVVVMLFGDLFQIPQWVQDLSPFEHLPLMPAEPFRWAPFLGVLAVAVSLSVAGQLAFLRRDVH